MKKVLVFGLNHFHYLTSFINSLESLGCLTTVCKYSIIDKKRKVSLKGKSIMRVTETV